jgi:sigma-B regulation protein RsbU (phosphoserine phosphatase)
MLVLYSDGITEAMNEDEDEFGEEQLTESIKRHRHKSASDVITEILDEIKCHTDKTPQMDDMTLMVIKRDS